MRTIEQMVQQEIQCCLSSLISTLARDDARPGTNLAELCDRALGLAMPVPDYEEAARQAGWHRYQTPAGISPIVHDGNDATFETWEACCTEMRIEPIDSEVYEHWAVSPWLAEKLIARGEKVDTDFADLNVWARQNTGQEITADDVIAKIYTAMMKV